MRTQFASALLMLMAGLLLLLVMVCANVAGLVMARIAARQGELAVRITAAESGLIPAIAVQQCRHEAGVRMALGAQQSSIIWLFKCRTQPFQVLHEP